MFNSSISPNNAMLIRPKVKFKDFEFFADDFKNPMFLMLLCIALDPTIVQEEVLNASGIIIKDANDKTIWPRPEEDEENV